MTKPGHKEPLKDNADPASLISHAEETQLRIGEELKMPKERDAFDRKDAQGRETTGQIYDETAGMSPTQASRHQKAKFAGHLIGKNIEERAARTAEEEARRIAEENEKISQLLRGK